MTSDIESLQYLLTDPEGLTMYALLLARSEILLREVQGTGHSFDHRLYRKVASKFVPETSTNFGMRFSPRSTHALPCACLAPLGTLYAVYET